MSNIKETSLISKLVKLFMENVIGFINKTKETKITYRICEEQYDTIVPNFYPQYRTESIWYLLPGVVYCFSYGAAVSAIEKHKKNEVINLAIINDNEVSAVEKHKNIPDCKLIKVIIHEYND